MENWSNVTAVYSLSLNNHEATGLLTSSTDSGRMPSVFGRLVRDSDDFPAGDFSETGEYGFCTLASQLSFLITSILEVVLFREGVALLAWFNFCCESLCY